MKVKNKYNKYNNNNNNNNKIFFYDILYGKS